MQWFYFAASSVAFFSVLNLLQRKIAVDTKYPWATGFVFTFYGAVISLIIFFFTGGIKSLVWPHVSIAWIFMLFATIFYAFNERGRFLAAKLLDASVLTIVSNVSLAVAFVGSLFIYSETLTMHKIIGVALILFALALISIQKNIHKKVSMKGIFVAVLIFTAMGFAWMLDKSGATYFNPNTYNVLVWTIPLIFVYLPYIKTEEIVYEAKLASWKVVLLAGLNVIGYYLQLQALRVGDATKIIPIVQTSTIVTVLMGILILGEKDFVWRKIFASLIGLAGAYLLVVA